MPYWMVTTGPDDQPGINGGLLPRQGEIDGQAVIAYVCTMGVESLTRRSPQSRQTAGRSRCRRCLFPEWAGWPITKIPKAISSG